MDNLNTEETRKKYLPEIPNTVRFFHIKTKEGDDASCISLNRTQTPTLLGVVPDDMVRLGAFVKSGSQDNPWKLLEEELSDGCIPGIVGDSDTAEWNLKKRVNRKDGDIITFSDEQGETFRVRLVGKIPVRVSILHGMVIIPAKHFVMRFSSESGWKILLVDVPDKQMQEKVGNIISKRLLQYGADVIPAQQELTELIAGQQRYLRMFLTLGGLGLLLGTIGLGIVLCRNVYERRYELALLRAVGFHRGILSRNIVLEHILLLLMGLGAGYLSAIVAIVPVLLISRVVPPWQDTITLFLAVLVAGILSAWLAVKIITRKEIIYIVNE